MGLLTRRSPRELMARRGGAIVVVAGLHVLVVAALLHMRYADRPTAEPVAIQLADFSVQQNDQPAPELEVKLIEPPEFEVVVPLVTIHLATPPPMAISSPPAAPPVAQNIRQVVHESGPVTVDVDDVDYLVKPNPVYPRAAKQARIEGKVLLWVLIDPQGKPRDVKVHRTSGSDQLDRAAREAVLGWLFKPYLRDGVALSAQFIVPMEFTLTNRRSKRG